MATRDFRTILTKIVSALAASTGVGSLGAIVGTRIYQGWPPGKATFPLLAIWSEDLDSSARVDQGPTAVYDFGFSIEAASYSPDQLRQIDGFIYSLLGFKGLTSVTGWRNVTVEVDGSTGVEDREQTPVLHRRVWTLRATAESA